MKAKEETILQIVTADQNIQFILHTLQSLHLKDAWLCAGTIRNFMWNRLSGKPGFDNSTDVDIIFYDPHMTWETTASIEAELNNRYPIYQWELRDQVDMHFHSPNTQPYENSRDAMMKYPETCTAIGVRLTETGDAEWFYPYGLQSILSFEVRPTPHFLADPERMAVYRQRLSSKNWRNKWPQLKYHQK